MNFWTGLILGIIIGWLVEWIIDWLFWRRDAEEADLLMEERLAATADLEADWEAQFTEAELEYQTRLRAVEEEWQARLNLNEQQWQTQFTALEADNSDLRSRLSDMMAVSTLGAAGATPDREVIESEEAYDSPDEALYAEDVVITDADVKAADVDLPADFDLSAEVESWQDEQLSLEAEVGAVETAEIEAGGLAELAEMNSDIVERLHLAGIDSVDELAEADPAGLSVALGLAADETEQWIERAAAALPEESIPPAIDVETLTDVDVEAIAPPPIDVDAFVEADVATRGGLEIAADVDTVDAGASPEAPADDLTKVRGIGPKFAATLSAAGITTYEQLAAATPDELRDIIKPSAMQKLNFESWSSQSAALIGTRSVAAGDDLTELEGIGPVYAAKLREGGIVSFADLAAAGEARLSEIIDAPAWRRIQYEDWIAQATLAAAGDKIALREYQDRLFRRDGDNLTLIHGLGSRSATALQAAGIDSFAALAAATPQQLEAGLQEAGVRGGFDYEAWISEAELRAAGKRVPATTRARAAVQVVACPQDLSAVDGIGTVFEDRLYAAGIGSYWSLAELPADELGIILEANAGVDLEAIKASAMQLAADTNSQGRVWSGSPPDDFNILSGIGEVYERRLYEAGICTYEALAATSTERLAEICQAPPMQTPDYAAWVSTAAGLAAGRSG